MLSSRFIGTPLLLVVGLTTSAAVSSPFDAALPRASSRRLAIPTLQSVEPFRLVVGPGAQAITVSGTDPALPKPLVLTGWRTNPS